MPDNLDIFSTLVPAVHWLIALGLSLRVIARRLPIGISLAWLAIILSVPFVGAAAYLVFGGKRLGAERIARHKAVQADVLSSLATLRESPHAASPTEGTPGAILYRHTIGIMGMPALKGNRISLLQNYETVFDAWVESIDNAANSCRLAFYIWHEGGRADDVVDALLRARSRGVNCQVLIDSVGSKPFLQGQRIKSLLAAGVKVVEVLPPSLRRRADLRYHRKIVVVDGRIGYTGSQNLVDPRFFKQTSGVGFWVDAVVRIEGPAVTLLENIFEQDWCIETGAAFNAPIATSGTSDNVLSDGTLMQVVPSGPAPYPDAIRQLLLTAIYSARQTLTLTSPYFVPDEAVLTALISAARSGVDVTLIVPALNDWFLVRYASMAPFEDLMEAGVRIALFQGGLLHTKSMVIDGTLSLFGSVNLDMRSFWLNFEDSIFVYGSEFTAQIVKLQKGYLAHSVLVDAATWRERSNYHRIMENVFRLIGPLL